MENKLKEVKDVVIVKKKRINNKVTEVIAAHLEEEKVADQL